MTSLQNRCGFFVNDSVNTLMSDADYASVKLYNGYSDGMLIFASVCYVISMIVGIPGNLITIVALANCKKVRNATAIFIINLSCTDLLLLCFDAPLTISSYWSRSWTNGRSLCQLYSFAKCMLVAASVFTIVAITINRYILIMYPRHYRKIYQKRYLSIMLAAIWITSVSLLIPTYLGKWGCFYLDPEDGPCSIVPDQHDRSSKQVLFVSVLCLPSALIIYCYARIFSVVRRTTKKSQNTKTRKTQCLRTEETSSETLMITRFPGVPNNNIKGEKEYISLGIIGNFKSEQFGASIMETPYGTSCNVNDKTIPEPLVPPRNRRNILLKSMKFIKFSLPTRKDKRLGTMIFAIMTSFCLCYLPTVITATLSGVAPQPNLSIPAQILLSFSCAINPVIYFVMSNEYHKAYKNLFNCLKSR